MSSIAYKFTMCEIGLYVERMCIYVVPLYLINYLHVAIDLNNRLFICLHTCSFIVVAQSNCPSAKTIGLCFLRILSTALAGAEDSLTGKLDFSLVLYCLVKRFL